MTEYIEASSDDEETIIIQDSSPPKSYYYDQIERERMKRSARRLKKQQEAAANAVIVDAVEHPKPVEPKPKRGRPRKVDRKLDFNVSETPHVEVETKSVEVEVKSVENETKTVDRGRRQSAARLLLPIDDEAANYFPCPVDDCHMVGKTRTERNVHLKEDHHGYVYKEGDGEDKKRKPAVNKKKPRVVYRTTTPVAAPPKPPYVNPFSTPVPVVLPVSKAESSKASGSWEKSQDDERYSEVDEDEFAKSYEKRIKQEEADTDNAAQSSVPVSRPLFIKMRKRGRPRNPPGAEPAANSKVRISDPNGKYHCYMPDCDWKGGYRSIRADHMKWCHKDWERPPRYLLQRASRDGTYIDPNTFEPEYSCLVEGCNWKGNFRGSRSSHMRITHPEFRGWRRKAPAGGFVADGKYECHEPSCGWRGTSRSTRAAHMKKYHPGHANPAYSQRSLPCCDCNAQCPSHKVFVDHLVAEHRIGGMVQREFSDVRDYEEWFHAVQDAFSVEFLRRMGIKQTEHYQVLYLYCARSGGYRQKRMRTGQSFVPDYMKRRPQPRAVSKCGKNCAAFLRILHWTDGRLTVVGCVEHTGHRLGTSLLRLSPSEREILDEYLYIQEDDTPLELLLDKLRDMEGFVMDGFNVIPRTAEELATNILDPTNELNSLKLLIENTDIFPPNSVFNVNLVDQRVETNSEGLTLGIMTDEMKELWVKYSSRATCIEEVRLMISSWDVSLSFVLVFDDNDVPRCACVYLSQRANKHPLLRQLSSIQEKPIDTVVTDCSVEWPLLIEQYFGEATYNSDLQIAEWHILPEWANRIDQIVSNRVDKFSLLCILRRWIRASEPTLFEAIVIDLFEAFREMELDELAHFFDAQLIVPEYAKRWTPLTRNPLTEHNNPVLEFASRTFRERFLNCEQCSRLDEYAGLLLKRIKEFNSCQPSEMYATGTIDPPRVVPPVYEDVDPGNVLADGSLVQGIHHEDAPGLDAALAESALKRPKIEDYEEGSPGKMTVQRMDSEEPFIIHSDSGFPSERMTNVVPALKKNTSDSSSVASTENDRKARIERMMQSLKDRVCAISDQESMEMLENSLSQVVDRLETSISTKSDDSFGISTEMAPGSSGIQMEDKLDRREVEEEEVIVEEEIIEDVNVSPWANRQIHHDNPAGLQLMK